MKLPLTVGNVIGILSLVGVTIISGWLVYSWLTDTTLRVEAQQSSLPTPAPEMRLRDWESPMFKCAVLTRGSDLTDVQCFPKSPEEIAASRAVAEALRNVAPNAPALPPTVPPAPSVAP